jgi:hypothetical protein
MKISLQNPAGVFTVLCLCKLLLLVVHTQHAIKTNLGIGLACLLMPIISRRTHTKLSYLTNTVKLYANPDKATILENRLIILSYVLLFVVLRGFSI